MTTLTLTADSSTDAAFRAWGGGISAAIAGLGLVQTADTGQINWTTVNKPAGVSTWTGYEIWRFADALQATVPIYFKLEYGSGASNASFPAMRITVGTGSDGAGTITGTYFPGVAASSSTVNFGTFTGAWNTLGPTPTTVYANGGTSALCLLLWPTFTSSASMGGFFALERTHDFDGTDNADGYSLIWGAVSGSGTSTGGHRAQSFLANGFTPTNTDYPAIVGRQSGSTIGAVSSTVAGTLYPTPIFTGYNLRLGAPSQWVCAYPRGDYAGNQSRTISHFGTNRTWLSLGMGSSTTAWTPAAVHANSYLVRISS